MPKMTEEQKKDAEEAMTKLADSLRARAAKGDDPDKLQKEAYVAAGLNGNTVNTKLEKQRRLEPALVIDHVKKPSAN